MYSLDKRRKAIELYIKYNFNVDAVVKELEYPSRRILYKWYKDYIDKGGIPDKHTKRSIYTADQKKRAVEHYLNNGRKLSTTIKALGYPSRTTLRTWIDEVSSVSSKRCNINKYLIRYSDDIKKQAVFDLCSRSSSAEAVSKLYNIPRPTLYRWKRDLLSLEKIDSMSKNKNENKEMHKHSNNTLISERDELTLQVDKLRKEVQRLQLENDILEKAGELLKKEVSINPKLLKNNEKTILVNALKSKYKVSLLLKILNMANSSYYYHINKLLKGDKYLSLRQNIIHIYEESRNTYGYRRIYAVLKKKGFMCQKR